MDCSVVSMKGQTETEKLDRDIRLWSSGKETDIRLLLSTLHHVTFYLLLIFQYWQIYWIFCSFIPLSKHEDNWRIDIILCFQ